MSGFAIETKGLTKRYRDLVAVNRVNLGVKKGEVFGLIGPNGAGKTTLIQLLCGLLELSSGEARVCGHDPVEGAEAMWEKIGYISQEFSLYGKLTVEENLEFFADIHRVPPQEKGMRKERLLKFSRLDPFTDRPAEKLSGGMQKKLALCCALIHEPQVLFLDEPTTGVDPVSRREFWKILSDVQAKGVTIFISTPYLDEAERCHRVGLMHRGEIFLCGTPEAIKESLKGELLEGRLTKELAGGFRERLALGCALLHEPEVLFLDEPTAGLDPIARQALWNLLYELSDKGVTVFVTTHYLDEAEHCHSLGLIHGGRLIARGSPAELREDMKAGEMLELETSRPLEALAVLWEQPFAFQVAMFGNKVHILIEDPREAVQKIRESLERKGVEIHRLQPIPLSLEDVFVTFIEMERKGRKEREGSGRII